MRGSFNLDNNSDRSNDVIITYFKNDVAQSGVDTSVVEVYQIKYNFTDAGGNSAPELIRTVNIVDTTKPVITINGATTINHQAGTTYTDRGATCTDNHDNNVDLTNQIVATLRRYNRIRHIYSKIQCNRFTK